MNRYFILCFLSIQFLYAQDQSAFAEIEKTKKEFMKVLRVQNANISQAITSLQEQNQQLVQSIDGQTKIILDLQKKLQSSNKQVILLSKEIAKLKQEQLNWQRGIEKAIDEESKSRVASDKRLVEVLANQPSRSTTTETTSDAEVSHRGVYEVVAGDTLSMIAKAFKTSVPKIKQANGLKSDNIYVGQKLKIP
ncbi:MAG: LysM peptidoglycan-binding domain-containing protein [Lentisphaeria bacterium]|nr:LysM peptidoglycan-binding domain-containing protein [Lentisphaeria bacterium]